MSGMYGAYPMTREASGTSWQPEATPLQGLHLMRDEWMMMFEGYVDATYDHQGGDRGDDQMYSASMFMAMAQRPLGRGTLGLRGMLSLDPAMGSDGYPLLLQNGETADGRTPLIDRQHPHDLFMELAATYSHPVTENSSWFGYFGLPGEPALGPPAFMHRFSGRDIPEAPITHHWLDATHITYGVATLGFVWQDIKMEGSVFRGREPDEDRWDIEAPAFDSYSGRISWNPAPQWAFQASYGALNSPEQLEPGVDVGRTTVSASYHKAFGKNNWQTTFAWGRNDNKPGRALDGFLLEMALNIAGAHTVFSRFENVEKDELFEDDDPLAGKIFDVNKLVFGYIYDFPAVWHVRAGVGSSVSVCLLPDELDEAYGDEPVSYMIFVRFKLG